MDADQPEIIRVVLADDHPGVLASLEHLFASEPDILVVASCLTGGDALAALQSHPASVLVLDLRMPGQHGLEVLRAIRNAALPTQVVLFTAAVDDDEMLEAFRLGARGLVLKEMSPAVLLQSIRAAHAGGRWLDPQFSRRAVDRLPKRETGMRRVAAMLSPLEIATLRAAARGTGTERIAHQLQVSESDVKTHLRHVYAKLGLGSRPALVRYAHDNALV